MALIATVNKKSVEITPDGRYNITFNLKLTDDSVEVINTDYSCRYKTGENVTSKLAIIVADMRKVINDYKSQKVIFNSTAMNNAVTSIQNGLTV